MELRDGQESKTEEIIAKLREVEVRLSQGETTGQAKRMKDMEAENHRLRKAVSDLTLDNQILKEVAEGKY